MYETLHSIKNFEEAIIIKQDMHKAYDRVSWKFLDQILERFGFHNQGRTWMRKCISIATFYVLVNGEATGFFNSSRGLRQGDSL